MSRFSKQTSYGHFIGHGQPGRWWIEWTVDRYTSGSRLRWPTSYRRETDYAGSVRFAKKWGIDPPENPNEEGKKP